MIRFAGGSETKLNRKNKNNRTWGKRSKGQDDFLISTDFPNPNEVGADSKEAGSIPLQS
jgi:hypothetical protein